MQFFSIYIMDKELVAYNLEVFSLGMYLVGSVLFVLGASAAIIAQRLRI
jgi:hypothetical protein